MREDGDLKLNEAVILSKQVISASSLSGQEIILRELERSKSDWGSLVSDMSQVRFAAL